MTFNVPRVVTQRETHEGGRAYVQAPEQELYQLAAASLVMGDTFYEKGDERLARLRSLLDTVCQTERGRAFVPALAAHCRDKMYLRSLPAALVAESFLHKLYGAEAAATAVWLRGDEHLESMAYVRAVGSKFPKRMLKAVARRLLGMSVRQMTKYARSTRTFSQRDAVRLTHPKPLTDTQSALLRYLTKGWDSLSDEQRALLPSLNAQKTGETAGETWEQIVSAKGSTPEAWTEAIPTMGYMALLRNLRNLCDKKLPEQVLRNVATLLSDPAAVANSKQLPYRFFSAMRALQHDAPQFLIDALSEAMDLAGANLPTLQGQTLLIVDVSGSMNDRLSEKSEVRRVDAAASLAAIMHRRGATCYAFNSDTYRMALPRNTPSVMIAHTISNLCGGGTFLEKAIRAGLTDGNPIPHRIVILTDGQAHDNPGAAIGEYLTTVTEGRVYVVNLAGYEPQPFMRHPRTFHAAGFSDRVFDWITATELADPVSAILGAEL